VEKVLVRDLSFQYALGSRKVLDSVNFSVEEGDFVVIAGPTGSGKTTLLRMLKRELTPRGELSGAVLFEGRLLQGQGNEPPVPDREAASRIGFVLQRPEQQIVADKVWHELAFGLENLNTPQAEIRRKVSEMAGYFDMESWFESDTDALSGGQKQLLNLASVMTMQPGLLLLDEPTSQLDPGAAVTFLSKVSKLNREMGLTVILVEHRLEEVIPMASKLLLMDQGKVTAYGTPEKVCGESLSRPDFLVSMPAPVRLYYAAGRVGHCPLTVLEGRRWLAEHYSGAAAPVGEAAGKALADAEMPADRGFALELSDLCFRYDRKGRDVLKGASLSVREGETLCILGGNGSGKTTLLSCAAGLRKAYSGGIRVFGKPLSDYKGNALYKNCLTMLPQDVQTVFLKNTVREELSEAGEGAEMIPYDFTKRLDAHPYDLSGGEQQLLALCKVLAAKPRLLLLDEPTKGIDRSALERLIEVLNGLKKSGMTIVVVTHDPDLAARIADRCALFFRGEVVSEGTPREFFRDNQVYTTAVNRMTRGIFDGCITLEDAVSACRQAEPAGGVAPC